MKQDNLKRLKYRKINQGTLLMLENGMRAEVYREIREKIGKEGKIKKIRWEMGFGNILGIELNEEQWGEDYHRKLSGEAEKEANTGFDFRQWKEIGSEKYEKQETGVGKIKKEIEEGKITYMGLVKGQKIIYEPNGYYKERGKWIREKNMVRLIARKVSIMLL